jgi:hypothetical protein
LGAVALAISVWALYNNLFDLLVLLGFASLLALLLIPFIVAYLAAKSTLQEMSAAPAIRPIRDYVASSLRWQAFLLTVDAAVFIPLLAIFSLYVNLLFQAIIMRLPTCMSGPCSQAVSRGFESTYNQYTIAGLLLGLGLWGMNLLACVLGVGLTIRWQRIVRAMLGAWAVLALTVVAMCILLFWEPQLYLVVIAALLPYVLAYASYSYLQRSTMQRAVASG